MNPNDRVRVRNNTDAGSLYAGQEGNVIQVVRYEDVPELADLLHLAPENGTAFVAVQIDGQDRAVTDDDLLMAELFGGVPTTLINIMREHRTATLFDDFALELVQA